MIERLLAATAGGLYEVRGEAGVGGPPAGRRVNALAADGESPWLLVEGGRLWHGGEEVASVPAGLEGQCVLASGERVLVGTSGARLLALGPGGGLEPVEGFDRAEGRSRWYTPWGGPPDTRSLATAPDGTLFANVHVGGILRSGDGGASWAPAGIDIDADVHQVLTAGDLVLAAAAVGLAASGDGGATFSVATAGLHDTYCRAVAVAGDWVLVSASEGPRGTRSALYRRPVAGRGPFERCRDGLPEWFDGNVDTHCLVGLGSGAAVGTAGGEVYVSADAGASWALASSGLPAVLGLLALP